MKKIYFIFALMPLIYSSCERDESMIVENPKQIENATFISFMIIQNYIKH